LFILVLPPFWPFYPCPSFIRSLLVLATLWRNFTPKHWHHFPSAAVYFFFS
jgi:hypothetical protein